MHLGRASSHSAPEVSPPFKIVPYLMHLSFIPQPRPQPRASSAKNTLSVVKLVIRMAACDRARFRGGCLSAFGFSFSFGFGCVFERRASIFEMSVLDPQGVYLRFWRGYLEECNEMSYPLADFFDLWVL